MLKIARLKWQGKCKKHPRYHPEFGGLGAIKGNCQSCWKLYEIHQANEKCIKLMRDVAPPVERKPRKKPTRQIQMFEEPSS